MHLGPRSLSEQGASQLLIVSLVGAGCGETARAGKAAHWIQLLLQFGIVCRG